MKGQRGRQRIRSSAGINPYKLTKKRGYQLARSRGNPVRGVGLPSFPHVKTKGDPPRGSRSTFWIHARTKYVGPRQPCVFYETRVRASRSQHESQRCTAKLLLGTLCSVFAEVSCLISGDRDLTFGGTLRR